MTGETVKPFLGKLAESRILDVEGREILSQQERRFVRFQHMKTTSQPDARRAVPSPPSGEREKKPVRFEHPGKHRTRSDDARDFARHLRQESTPSEKRLWRLLRDRHFSEFKFRRQYACGPYFLDFHCTLAQLAVELDGGHHGFPDERARDEERNRFLATKDIKVLRFWNHQLRGELESVRFEIWYALMERTGQTAELVQFKARPAEAYGQELSAEARGRAGLNSSTLSEWVRPSPSPRPSPPMGERESRAAHVVSFRTARPAATGRTRRRRGPPARSWSSCRWRRR